MIGSYFDLLSIRWVLSLDRANCENLGVLLFPRLFVLSYSKTLQSHRPQKIVITAQLIHGCCRVLPHKKRRQWFTRESSRPFEVSRVGEVIPFNSFSLRHSNPDFPHQQTISRAANPNSESVTLWHHRMWDSNDGTANNQNQNHSFVPVCSVIQTDRQMQVLEIVERGDRTDRRKVFFVMANP
jgi:hypothetical protein